MTIYRHPARTLAGQELDLHQFAGSAILIVNVASKCGHTPQYAGLEALYEKYKDRGLVVLGVPSNQFGGQEPGSAAEIAEFCSATYGVTFPMLAKADVNGEGRHPLYAELAELADDDGSAGDIEWNFEKFVISPDGTPVARFRSKVTPDDPALVAAVEAQLPR